MPQRGRKAATGGRKQKEGAPRGGERVVVRWERVEAAETEQLKPEKRRSDKPKRENGRSEFDKDALVDASDGEGGREEEEEGTFGGSAFVMVDIVDELEELALEASGAFAGGAAQPLRDNNKKKKKAGKKEKAAAPQKPPGQGKKAKQPKNAEASLLEAVVETEEKVQVKNEKKTKKKKKKDQQQSGIALGKPEMGGSESRDKKRAAITINQKVEIVATSTVKQKIHRAKSAAPGLEGETKSKKANRQAKEAAEVNSAAKDQKPPRGRSERGRRQNGEENVVYTDYLPRELVTQGLEDGTLLQGKLRVNAMYRMDGYVTVDGISMDILVKGMSDRNRAVDGDLVAIKLYSEEEWKDLGNGSSDMNAAEAVAQTPVSPKFSPLPGDIDTNALHSLWRPSVDSSKCIIQRSENGLTATDSPNKLKLEVARINERVHKCQARPTAKVVFVLASGNSGGFIGCLEPKSKITDLNAPLPLDDAFAYFNAHDQRLPRRIQIPRLQLPDEFIRRPLVYSKTMLCFCRIQAWSTKFRSPMGEFVKTVGEYTGIETGISAILSKTDLQAHTLDFSSAILEELDAKYGTSGEKWVVPDEEVQKRRDFRDYQIFSIDPYNARDLDDALHIRALNEDRTAFEIGVHIADVTHFVERNSLLDKEAQSRATSVYLPNRVLPMLPRILCEKLCSLQPQVERLAFSVVWQMNIDGSLVEGAEPWFGKSIIRSCCKLDYGSAQKMLDGTINEENLDEWEVDRRPIPEANANITNGTVIQSVKDLWAIGKNRRAMRFETGAISLNDIKLVFSLDAKGNPTQYGSYQIKDSNRLVEEYMLLANFLVAQQLLRAHGPLAFIRHHPPPVERAMELTLNNLKEHALEIDGSATKRLSDSLDRVRIEKGATVFAIVQAMLIKPMKPAEYMVAGNGASPDSWRHYALNIPYYTHFTSPIRRYADVVVHRLLQESVATQVDDVASPEQTVGARLIEFTSIAQNCNDKKMAAKSAEKECDEVFLCAYVKNLGAVEVTGVVMSSGQLSFTLYIMELGVERRMFLKDLHIPGSWDEKSRVLSIQLPNAKQKQKRLRPRQRLRAQKAEAEAQEQKIDQVLQTEDEEQKGEEKEREGPDGEETAVQAPPRVLRLDFMTKLRLRMSATNKMPLALTFSLIGAADNQ